MRCPNCGADNENPAEACTSCGSALESGADPSAAVVGWTGITWHCTCGEINVKSAVTCRSCGCERPESLDFDNPASWIQPEPGQKRIIERPEIESEVSSPEDRVADPCPFWLELLRSLVVGAIALTAWYLLLISCVHMCEPGPQWVGIMVVCAGPIIAMLCGYINGLLSRTRINYIPVAIGWSALVVVVLVMFRDMPPEFGALWLLPCFLAYFSLPGTAGTILGSRIRGKRQ